MGRYVPMYCYRNDIPEQHLYLMYSTESSVNVLGNYLRYYKILPFKM